MSYNLPFIKYLFYRYAPNSLPTDKQIEYAWEDFKKDKKGNNYGEY